jgi:hypothetical protein
MLRLLLCGRLGEMIRVLRELASAAMAWVAALAKPSIATQAFHLTQPTTEIETTTARAS